MPAQAASTQLAAAKVSRSDFPVQTAQIPLTFQRRFFATVMWNFESCEVSQAVAPVKARPQPIAEKPANGGLLHGRSPSSQSTVLPAENAESLWWFIEEFPFSGDSGRRPGSLRTGCPVS